MEDPRSHRDPSRRRERPQAPQGRPRKSPHGSQANQRLAAFFYNRTLMKKLKHSTPKPPSIQAAKGKLGILLPGMGAVATTFVAGTLSARKGLGKPIGSM